MRDEEPIGQWEYKSLHEIEFISGYLLIAIEGLIDDSIEFKLSQHQFHSANKQGTTSIPCIFAW